MSWVPAAIGLATSFLAPRPKIRASAGELVATQAAQRLLDLDTNADWSGSIDRYFDAAVKMARESMLESMQLRDAQAAIATGNPFAANNDTNTALANAALARELVAPVEMSRAQAKLGIPERRASVLSAASGAGATASQIENQRRQAEAQARAQSASNWGTLISQGLSLIPGMGGAGGAGTTSRTSTAPTSNWLPSAVSDWRNINGLSYNPIRFGNQAG